MKTMNLEDTIIPDMFYILSTKSHLIKWPKKFFSGAISSALNRVILTNRNEAYLYFFLPSTSVSIPFYILAFI